jgi:hypothetical protein
MSVSTVSMVARSRAIIFSGRQKRSSAPAASILALTAAAGHPQDSQDAYLVTCVADVIALLVPHKPPLLHQLAPAATLATMEEALFHMRSVWELPHVRHETAPCRDVIDHTLGVAYKRIPRSLQAVLTSYW